MRQGWMGLALSVVMLACSSEEASTEAAGGAGTGGVAGEAAGGQAGAGTGGQDGAGAAGEGGAGASSGAAGEAGAGGAGAAGEAGAGQAGQAGAGAGGGGAGGAAGAGTSGAAGTGGAPVNCGLACSSITWPHCGVLDNGCECAACKVGSCGDWPGIEPDSCSCLRQTEYDASCPAEWRGYQCLPGMGAEQAQCQPLETGADRWCCPF